jgi:hypothetical protein
LANRKKATREVAFFLSWVVRASRKVRRAHQSPLIKALRRRLFVGAHGARCAI